MTRICVTGASGFIGRVLAERWRADGAEVVGVDRVEDRDRGVVAGDVSDPDHSDAHTEASRAPCGDSAISTEMHAAREAAPR